MAKPAPTALRRKPQAGAVPAGAGKGSGKGFLPVSGTSKKIDRRKGTGITGAATAAAAASLPGKVSITGSPAPTKHFLPSSAAKGAPASLPGAGMGSVSKKQKPSKAQRRAQKLTKRALRGADGEGEGDMNGGVAVGAGEGEGVTSGVPQAQGVKRSKQGELDGKGVRLTGKLAARVGSKGETGTGTGSGSRDPKGLHLSRMLPGFGGQEGEVVSGLDWGEQRLGGNAEDEDEEEDEEGEEEEGEGEMGEGSGFGGPGGVPKRDPIYNVDGIHEKMEAFAWCDEAEWVETLAVTNDDDTAEKVDVNDDLAREVALYTQVCSCLSAGQYC